MPDYDKKTGNWGTLRIRDTGTTVEFWLLCTSATTFNNNNTSWSGTVNGANVSGTFKLPKGWSPLKIATYTPTSSQTVKFNIADTGTSGMGGPTSHSAAVTRATKPPAPNWDSGGMIARTTTSMTLAFRSTGNGGSTIIRWELQRSTSSSFNANVVTITSGGTSTVTGLTPGTRYYWRARGVNAIGAGAWTSTLTTDTLNVPVAPGVPTVTTLADVSVVLGWAAPTDNRGATVTGYEIWLASNTAFTSNVQKKSTNATTRTATFTGLSRTTTYYARVFAKSNNGNSANSGNRTLTTHGLPSAPGGPNTSGITNTAATVTWTAPSDLKGSTLTGYGAQIATNSAFTENLQTVEKGATTLSHQFTGLSPLTKYYTRVVPQSNFGNGSYSAWIALTTSTFSIAPVTPTVTLPSTTSAKASWLAPSDLRGSTVTGYRAQIATNTAFTSGLQTMVTSASVRTTTFLDLSEATPYWVRVQAITNYGDSAWSSSRAFTTGITPIVDPLFLKVSGVYKRGVLWVKVAGVWRQTRPWIKVSNVWRSL